MAQEIATAVARKNLARVVRRIGGGHAHQAHALRKEQAVLIPEDDFMFLEQCERGRRSGAPREALLIRGRPSNVRR